MRGGYNLIGPTRQTTQCPLVASRYLWRSEIHLEHTNEVVREGVGFRHRSAAPLMSAIGTFGDATCTGECPLSMLKRI